MSALSVFKPAEQGEPAKKLSAADLLAGTAKKGKASTHLVYAEKAGQELASRWLELNAKLAEIERDLGLAPRSDPRRDPALARRNLHTTSGSRVHGRRGHADGRGACVIPAPLRQAGPGPGGAPASAFG